MFFLFTLAMVGLILYVVFSIIGIIVFPLVGLAIVLAVVLGIIGIIFKIVFSKYMLALVIIVAIFYFFNEKKH